MFLCIDLVLENFFQLHLRSEIDGFENVHPKFQHLKPQIPISGLGPANIITTFFQKLLSVVCSVSYLLFEYGRDHN